ncbi:glutamate receptor ionotropic, delta-2-like [Panulirus ornatus]|uniref:glutamate receptor ionotropic, delta-2-like n=1 Tax=Panulirus ornatus TaxID=150431 RepID=UPI003A8A5209
MACIRFEVVGKWDDLGTSGHVGQVWRPVFPNLDDLYEDFHGRKMTVTAVNNSPFFRLTYLEDGTPHPHSGIDVNIMNVLGRHLNFTYGVVEPIDRRWGGPEADGSVSGMVGMVARHEAHIAIDEITITGIRETVVDFTTPYFLESTTIVSRAPAEKNTSLAIFYPFTPLLWALVILMTLLMGPVSYLVGRGYDLYVLEVRGDVPDNGATDDLPPHHLSTSAVGHINVEETSHEAFINMFQGHYGSTKMSNLISQDVFPSHDSSVKVKSAACHKNMSYYTFNIFRSLIIQGNFISAGHWPIRIILFSWYSFCIIVYGMYAGTLTAYMTRPAFETPIDSLHDLLEATAEGFVPAVQVGTSNEALLKEAESGIFHQLWLKTDPSRSFPKNGHEAMLKVLEADIVYMSASLNSEIRATHRGRHLFYLARNTFLPQAYGIACPSGAPYRNKLGLMLGRIVQVGLVSKWVRDEVTNMENIITQDDVSRSLSLDHLQQQISSYVFKQQFNSNVFKQQIKTYVLKQQFSSYVFKEQISYYVLKKQISSYINSYVFKDEISSCVQTTILSHAFKQQILFYVIKQQINSYVFKEQILSYLFKELINSYINSYVFKQQVISYVFKQQISSSGFKQQISSHVFKQISSYVFKQQVSSYESKKQINSYVFKQQINSYVFKL